MNLRVLDQEHYQILHLAENKILDHSINNNEKKKVSTSMDVIKLILREKNKDDIFYYVESHK